MSADLADDRSYSAWEARQLRYALYWALYENSAYRDIHRWSTKFRADYGLYKYIRGIHNPAFRLGEFYATHLMGGALDPEAGDGGAAPSALPILTDHELLRPAIAALWRASNWQTNKEIWTRRGSVLGDIGLKVVDDPVRRKVYLAIVHPGIVREVDRDPWGNVKGYILEEPRADPRLTTAQRIATRTMDERDSRQVTYTETANRDGDDVVFATYLNGQPYAWNGVAAEWREPYGFVPLVVTQHLNVGLEWGWSELHAGHGKFREVDDQASKLSDQIRKLVEAPWLLAGVENPNNRGRSAPTVTGASASTTRPEPGREEIPILYASDANAKPHPLVAPLDIAAVSARIKDLIAEIERDYPELQMDIWTAAGDASGRALRVARQRVTGKLQMRRAGYDDSLVRAQQMAIAIGGHRGYAGYQGFGLDSYAAGKLDHQIGPRPVFEVDPLDAIDEDKAFWEAAELAERSGYPLELYLEDKGWSQEKIERFTAAKQARQQQARALLPSGGTAAIDPDRAARLAQQALQGGESQ
jgi:hypothetical protein